MGAGVVAFDAAAGIPGRAVFTVSGIFAGCDDFAAFAVSAVFAVRTAVAVPEAFVLFAVREVEVTAFFTVSFVADFLSVFALSIFVVLVPAGRDDPATCRAGRAGAGGCPALADPDVGATARGRAVVFWEVFTLRAVAPAGLLATLPVRLVFATAGRTFFFEALDELEGFGDDVREDDVDDFLADCDARVAG